LKIVGLTPSRAGQLTSVGNGRIWQDNFLVLGQKRVRWLDG